MLYSVSATKDGSTVQHVYCDADVAWQHVEDFRLNGFEDIQIVHHTGRIVAEAELQARVSGGEPGDF